MHDGPDQSPAADASLRLPKHLDLTACADLSDQLTALRHTAVTISAAGVTFIGALALQLLLAAQRQWQQDGVPFRVTEASDAFRDGLALLGYPDFLPGSPPVSAIAGGPR